jgi:hypothetical protein
VTPELISYLTKKEFRGKKGAGEDDGDDARSRSEYSSKVKRNNSDDDEEDEEEEFDGEGFED